MQLRLTITICATERRLGLDSWFQVCQGWAVDCDLENDDQTLSLKSKLSGVQVSTNAHVSDLVEEICAGLIFPSPGSGYCCENWPVRLADDVFNNDIIRSILHKRHNRLTSILAQLVRWSRCKTTWWWGDQGGTDFAPTAQASESSAT